MYIGGLLLQGREGRDEEVMRGDGSRGEREERGNDDREGDGREGEGGTLSFATQTHTPV